MVLRREDTIAETVWDSRAEEAIALGPNYQSKRGRRLCVECAARVCASA